MKKEEILGIAIFLFGVALLGITFQIALGKSGIVLEIPPDDPASTISAILSFVPGIIFLVLALGAAWLICSQGLKMYRERIPKVELREEK